MPSDSQKIAHPKKDSGIWKKCFKEAFCETFACPPESYESKVFWRSIYPHALPVALLLSYFRPHFFDDDYELIRHVANVTHPGVFSTEMNFFHGRSIRHRSWWRRTLLIRISGQRMIDLKNRIFR